MFNQQQKRIGFACKLQTAVNTANPKHNTKTTTITWLNSQPRQKAVDRLYDLAKSNIEAVQQQLSWLATRPTQQRMMRLSSDLLPAYTHQDWAWLYWETDMVNLLEKGFGNLGEFARAHDIRLSFHPGQFCVLASDNPGIVENSIQEFEYHCDLIRYMGFGREFQDFKCNVHIGGKQGPQGIIRALKQLSREARNTLTIENAEFTWGLQHSLELATHCALVLDIHHHWIMTGEYITPQDPRIQQVQASWRGVRPVVHYSVSREDVLIDHDANTKPNLRELKSMGFTSTKLRAHSELYWNRACNTWATSHLEWADIMCEAKQKNIASQQLVEIL